MLPGHVVPVQVGSEGTLQRLSTAEAACDLVELAGMGAGAAICPILDDEGEIADAAYIESFAARGGLPVVTTLDVLDLRLRDEDLIERTSETTVETVAGPFVAVSYRETLTGAEQLALTLGELGDAEPLLLRVHHQDPLEHVFQADGGTPVLESLRAVAAAGRGVLLYLKLVSELNGSHTSDPAGSARARSSLLAATLQAHLATRILRDLGAQAILVDSAALG
jgi:3,4-dihydroxy 2-butanone 4-phosphate synthase/GTP cyclohydrolase II